MKTAPAVERIKSHIAQLENPHTNHGHRMMYFRLIADAALEAHSQEVQQLDELKAPTADPSLQSAFGEPVV